MLPLKDIKNLSELTHTFCDTHKKPHFFSDCIHLLQLGKLHGFFSRVKQKGIGGLALVNTMLCYVFVGQSNVWQFTNSPWQVYAKHGKDAYYRLKNNPKINWRGFLMAIVKQILVKLEDSVLTGLGIKALVFDDSTLEKTGYKIEGISRVWNHVINRSVLGYQLLVMGYYDGTIFMPLDFSFHREKGTNKKKPFGLSPKHYKKQVKKQRSNQSAGFTRKKELDCSKIAMAVKMMVLAVKKGISCDYVLTDSWFTCWEMVQTALKHNLKYIGMFSKVKTKFVYRNNSMTYKQIRRQSRKNIKRNRKFNLYYIRVVVYWHGVPIVLYFTRKGKNGNWKTLLSTELSSCFTTTIEVYQIRWSIEVFFKESKQLLGLGKSQSTDFDTQIADTTLVLIRYLFLSVKKRMENYESLGKLFENTKAECLEMRLHDRLIALLIAIAQLFDELFDQVDSQEIIARVVDNPAVVEKLKLLLGSQNELFKNVA